MKDIYIYKDIFWNMNRKGCCLRHVETYWFEHLSLLWHILLQRSPVSNVFCLQFESLCNANQGSLSGSSGMPGTHATFICPNQIGSENHGQKTKKNIPNHLRAPLIGALRAHEGLAHPGGDINPLQFVAVNLDMASGPPGEQKKKNTSYFGVIWVVLLIC